MQKKHIRGTTINNILIDNTINISYRPYDVLMAKKVEKLPTEYVDKILNTYNQLYGIGDLEKVFYYKLRKMKVIHKVSSSAFLPAMLLDLNSPNDIMVYILVLLNYYDTEKRPASVYGILKNLFPNGYYSQVTNQTIVDTIRHTGYARYGKIFLI